MRHLGPAGAHIDQYTPVSLPRPSSRLVHLACNALLSVDHAKPLLSVFLAFRGQLLPDCWSSPLSIASHPSSRPSVGLCAYLDPFYTPIL